MLTHDMLTLQEARESDDGLRITDMTEHAPASLQRVLKHGKAAHITLSTQKQLRRRLLNKHVHTHIHTQMHTHIHTHTYKQTDKQTHKHTHTHTHTRI